MPGPGVMRGPPYRPVKTSFNSPLAHRNKSLEAILMARQVKHDLQAHQHYSYFVLEQMKLFERMYLRKEEINENSDKFVGRSAEIVKIIKKNISDIKELILMKDIRQSMGGSSQKPDVNEVQLSQDVGQMLIAMGMGANVTTYADVVTLAAAMMDVDVMLTEALEVAEKLPIEEKEGYLELCENMAVMTVSLKYEDAVSSDIKKMVEGYRVGDLKKNIDKFMFAVQNTMNPNVGQDVAAYRKIASGMSSAEEKSGEKPSISPDDRPCSSRHM